MRARSTATRSGLPPLEHELETTVARIARKQGTLKATMLEMERRFLSEALAAHGGNRTKAAAALGIVRETMQKKLVTLDLPVRRGRSRAGLREIEKPEIQIAPKDRLKDVMWQVERWLVAEALREHRGNRTYAAAALGIERTTLHKKLVALDLQRARPKIEKPVVSSVWKKGTLRNMMQQVERWLLARALRDCGGNKTKAAAALGITREGVYVKFAKLGMRPVAFGRAASLRAARRRRG